MRLLLSDSRIFILSVALLLVPLLAGCISDEEPSSRFAAEGSGGVLYSSWDYAGETVKKVNARLDVDVDEVANSGKITAGAREGNDTMTIELGEFVHNTDDFHSGGIAANFDEHGDSGVGNALLPRMHLLIATWGPGTIMHNGNATVDPYTGGTEWDAHLMVTSTGVRHNDRVEKADGEGFYDPADPGNARIGTDTEAHLVLTSQYANGSLEPMNETLEGQTPATVGETTTLTFEVPVAAGDITTTIELGTDPAEGGRYGFTLVSPSGVERASKMISKLPPNMATTTTLEAEVTEAGTWSIIATSQGPPATFTADVNVVFPPKPMFYFFWENVDVTQLVVG